MVPILKISRSLSEFMTSLSNIIGKLKEAYFLKKAYFCKIFLVEFIGFIGNPSIFSILFLSALGCKSVMSYLDAASTKSFLVSRNICAT